MDCLEKRMHLLSDELESFKKRYATLENQNASLRSQLQQVQTQVANCHCIKAKDSVSKYFANLMKIVNMAAFGSQFSCPWGMGTIRNDNKLKTKVPPRGHSFNKCKHMWQTVIVSKQKIR